MRNLLCFLLIAVFYVSACTQNKPKAAAAQKPAPIIYKARAVTVLKYTTPALLQYAGYLQSLDMQKMETSYDAVQKFQEMFSTADTAVCDTAFYIFYRHYKRQTVMIDSLHPIQDSAKYDSLSSPKLVAYQALLKKNGLRIIQSEGEPYIVEDRDFIDKWFYGKISPALKIYLQQLNKESKEFSADDGSILISPKELIDRLIFWENFNNKHTAFIYTDKAFLQEAYYLRLMLNGSDNSELMYKHKLYDFFKEGAAYLQKRYPQSRAAKIIPKYYAFIQKSDITNAKNILSDYYKAGILTAKDYIGYGSEN